MTDVRENRMKIMAFLLFVAISIFTLFDIFLDMHDGLSIKHLLHEVALWFFSFVAAFYQFKIIKWQNTKLQGFEQKIEELDHLNQTLRAEQENFQKKISHLSTEFLSLIDEQFKQWNLTRGEKEIALLLIKGLSMKEIAAIREASENTVRQQASQIYKKSSLAGRMELSAFFLDDLLAVSKLPSDKG